MSCSKQEDSPTFNTGYMTPGLELVATGLLHTKSLDSSENGRKHQL